MAHVGVECLGSRGAEKDEAQDTKTRMVVGRGEEHQATKRVEGTQHPGVLDEVHEAGPAQKEESECHHGTEELADA